MNDTVKTAPKPPADMSFEEALKELEGIIVRLERGDMPLADAVEQYKRAETLRARCNTVLEEAELAVNSVTRGADGEPDTKPFSGE